MNLVDSIVARLLTLHPKRIDLSLDRMWRLLAALGHPERQLPPVIHVAGTNCKGSTVAFMRAILESAGQRVHVYTSPHLVRFNERFRLGQAGAGALVFAAAYVYRIKFDATLQAERLAKIRSEVRHERDTIAALRAEWGELDSPARIEALTKRYLQIKPTPPTQFGSLDQLPNHPPQFLMPIEARSRIPLSPDGSSRKPSRTHCSERTFR